MLSNGAAISLACEQHVDVVRARSPEHVCVFLHLWTWNLNDACLVRMLKIRSINVLNDNGDREMLLPTIYFKWH